MLPLGPTLPPHQKLPPGQQIERLPPRPLYPMERVAPIAKMIWTVAETRCPLGCSPWVQSLLDRLMGEKVTISLRSFDAPFARCDRPPSFSFAPKKVFGLVAELNRGTGEWPKFTDADLGIRDTETVLTASVSCREWPIARLIAIEPERILVLYEEDSIVELR